MFVTTSKFAISLGDADVKSMDSFLRRVWHCPNTSARLHIVLHLSTWSHWPRKAAVYVSSLASRHWKDPCFVNDHYEHATLAASLITVCTKTKRIKGTGIEKAEEPSVAARHFIDALADKLAQEPTPSYNTLP